MPGNLLPITKLHGVATPLELKFMSIITRLGTIGVYLILHLAILLIGIPIIVPTATVGLLTIITTTRTTLTILMSMVVFITPMDMGAITTPTTAMDMAMDGIVGTDGTVGIVGIVGEITAAMATVMPVMVIISGMFL